MKGIVSAVETSLKQALCDRVITRVFILQPTFSDVLPPCFHLLRRSKSLNQTLACHVAFTTRLSPFGYQECPVVTQTAALRTWLQNGKRDLDPPSFTWGASRCVNATQRYCCFICRAASRRRGLNIIRDPSLVTNPYRFHSYEGTRV